jgi:hypothetical protein
LEVAVKVFCILACAVLLLVGPLGYAANPVPFVNNPLVPASVAPGGAAFTLTVNGTGFVSASVVKWNGQSQPTTFVSQSQLKVQVSSSQIANPSTACVTVFSPAPGGGTSTPTYLPVAPPVSTIHLSDRAVGRALYIGGLITADLDGDGRLDLVASSGDNLTYVIPGSLGILYGNGDGTFQPTVRMKTQYFPGPAAADVNGDGKPDLLVFGGLDNQPFPPLAISVFLGNGDRTFQTPQKYPTNLYLAGLAIADFNGDGNLDMASTEVRALSSH